MNSSPWIGLLIYASIPAARHRSASPFSAWAVMAIIGILSFTGSRQRADCSRCLKAVHHRHLHIHQHNVVAGFDEHLQRLPAVLSDFHDVAASGQDVFGELLVGRSILGQAIPRRRCLGAGDRPRAAVSAFCAAVPCWIFKHTVKWNVLPWPGSLSTQIRPVHQFHKLARDGQSQPGASIIAGGGASACVNGNEDSFLILGRDADSGIGNQELESARFSGVCSLTSARTAILPAGVNFMALSTRFMRICLNRKGSPITDSGTRKAVIDQRQPFFLCPDPKCLDYLLDSFPGRLNGVDSSSNRPASIRDRSRISLRRSRRTSADSRAVCR